MVLAVSQRRHQLHVQARPPAGIRTQKGNQSLPVFLRGLNKLLFPPCSILFQDKKKEEKTEEISLEELIEQKRAELSARTDLTKVTIETFVAWKKRKLKEKLDKEKKDSEKKKDKFMSGMKVGLSGREMFTFDPKMMADEVRLLEAVLREKWFLSTVSWPCTGR